MIGQRACGSNEDEHDEPAEELIYVLVFGAILLVQYVMKRLAPQPQPSITQDGLVAEVAEREQAALQDIPVAVAPKISFDRSPPHGTALAAPRYRFFRKALMENRRGVQNFIVIATIIGRCRAFEPHTVR